MGMNVRGSKIVDAMSPAAWTRLNHPLPHFVLERILVKRFGQEATPKVDGHGASRTADRDRGAKHAYYVSEYATLLGHRSS